MPFWNRNGRQNSSVSRRNTNLASNDFASQAEVLIPAEVRMISSCHTEQTAADVANVSNVASLPNAAGKAGGACTSALLDILYSSKDDLTFQELLLELRKSLACRGFDQIPQLTSSRPLEVQQTAFTLVGGNGTGTRRALLVGINYLGQNGQLSGCHNDVLNMKQYLIRKQGYMEQNILVLVDDAKYSSHFPSRAKIIAGLRQLVAHSKAGDSAYFHYSGHGGLLTPERNIYKNNNKEYDETLYPLDHERTGQIRDFSLFNHFVKPMAAGVTVTCVIDSCHSGSVLDLPFSFQPTSSGNIRMRQNMTNLSNLAFLYILAGGMLPTGFDNVAGDIENVTGGNVNDYQGTGIEETEQDGFGIEEQNDYQDTVADTVEDPAGFEDDANDALPADGDFAAAGDRDEFVVQGDDVPATEANYGGYGDDTDYEYGIGDPGGGFYSGGEDTADPDADCGCVQDVLTSMLEDGADF